MSWRASDECPMAELFVRLLQCMQMIKLIRLTLAPSFRSAVAHVLSV